MACLVRVIVMRHMPTIGNEKRQYIGWTDEPIMDTCKVNWQLPWHPTEVYGSDLQRAKQSAAQYFPKAIYKHDSRFRESHFGDWEGKTYDMLKEDKTYRAWIDDPYAYAPPGGERLQETEQRVFAAFSALPIAGTPTILVTHGGPIRLLLTRFSPEIRDFWSWTIPHCSAWAFEWATARDFKEGKRCISLSAVPIMASEPM